MLSGSAEEFVNSPYTFFFLMQTLQQRLKDNPGSHPFDEVRTLVH